MKQTCLHRIALALAGPALLSLPALAQGWAAPESYSLLPQVAEDDQFFAAALAGDGQTLAVGAPHSFSTGVHVYERSTSLPKLYTLVRTITPGEIQGAALGAALALSGDTLVVGVPDQLLPPSAPTLLGAGYVLIFQRDQGGPGQWGLVRECVPGDGVAGQGYGFSVAIDGDTVLVGSPYASHQGVPGTGAVYVLERDQGGPDAWGEVARIGMTGPAGGDLYGFSVALSGDTAVVGVVEDDFAGSSFRPGSALVHGRDVGGTDAWGKVTRLNAKQPNDYMQFGFDVDIDGDTIAVGAPKESALLQHAGAAHVFSRDTGGPDAWGEVAALIGGDVTANSYFGWSLSLDGPRLLVGARYAVKQPTSTGPGRAYFFERTSQGTWSQGPGFAAGSVDAGDLFGNDVLLNGFEAIVGAPDETTAAGTRSGAVHVHAVGYAPVRYCTAGTSAAGCQAMVTATGKASASLTGGFVLGAIGVEGQRTGLALLGASGRQAIPWGNGSSFRCVVPPVTRAGQMGSGGTPGACDGNFVFDLNTVWCPSCPSPEKNPGVGELVQAQFWYRDPASTSNQTSSLSDALEFLVLP